MSGLAAVLNRAVPSTRRRLPGLVFGVLADASVVGLLALSMWLIVRAGDQPPILHLTFAIVGVRAFAIGRAAFRYTERLFSHDAALAQLSALRTETFTALIPRVPGAIERERRGEVLAAFVDDVDQLQDEPLRVRQPLLVSSIVAGLSLVIVALISVPAALALTSLLVVSVGGASWAAARIAGTSDRELSAARAAIVDALLDRFTAAEVLIAYGAVAEQRARIAECEAKLARVQLARSRAAGLTAGVLMLASGLASLVVLWLLLPRVGDDLSTAMFAAAVVVPAAVFEVSAQFPAALAARRTVRSSAARVASLSDAPLPPEIPVDGVSIDAVSVDDARLSDAIVDAASPGRDQDTNPGAPLVSVRDLAVRHPGAVSNAVQGVTFEVSAGETLVVTGESGAGKSTLALALVRFLDYGGQYRVRGIDANTLTGAAVRAIVGLCEQAPHLFDADLRQNLKFARDTATDEELMKVLDRVGLADWAHTRDGLDTRVGEQGSLVSGGQAQRIGLARAILADFPVVVLDEPTAGVDREVADRLMRDLLRAVPDDRAVILITHTEVPTDVPHRRVELPLAR